MKIILTIMCGAIILFGGGCVLVLASAGLGAGGGLLILLPLAIVALNLAVLSALYGWADMPAWPLYFLAGIDFLLAAVTGVSMLSVIQYSGLEALMGFVPVAIATVKGYLTFQVAKNRKPSL